MGGRQLNINNLGLQFQNYEWKFELFFEILTLVIIMKGYCKQKKMQFVYFQFLW